MMILLIAVLSVAAAAYLTYQNYQLEKRWRCMRYCWQTMSDFAGTSLKEDGEISERWRDTVKEQTAFMALFGVKPLTSDALRSYELALIERDLPTLTKHNRC